MISFSLCSTQATSNMCYSRAVIIILPITTSLAVLLSVIFFISQGSCPEGHFPCGNQRICIKQRHICDGYPDCPAGEDEEPLYCVLDEVPDYCNCTELTVVVCSGLKLKYVPSDISKSTTRLILAKNSITLRSNDFYKYSLHLIHLGDNNLNELPDSVFQGQKNLHKLFLFGNNLSETPKGVFKGLHNLSWLFLYNNKIQTLHFDDWDLRNLTWLELSKNRLRAEKKFPLLPALTFLNLDWNLIEKISNETFMSLPNLKDLSLGWNKIREIHPLAFNKNLNLQELNLRNNELSFLNKDLFLHTTNLQKLILGGNTFLVLEKHFLSNLLFLKSLDLQDIDINNPEMLSVLHSLESVYFKRFHYCTYVPHVPKCSPLHDGSSSVKDLLASDFLRFTLWLVAVFTIFTNGLVLCHRLASTTYSSPLNILITNLASSDFLMGIYLVLIGSQDLKYRGHYMIHARNWMSSWLCTTCGIIATVSSEVSVLMLLLISAERYLLIAAPLNEQRSLSPYIAKFSVIGVWIFGLFISILPVVQWRGAMKFYGTNGFCFPLHIEDPFLIGWQYSAGIFLGINGFGIIGIALLYFGVFLSIYKTRHATTLNVRDCEFALRFFIIVLTNFCCWVPIIIFKVLAYMDVALSGELYGWLAVFVLPINSAVDPILYTFSIPSYRSLIKPGESEEGDKFKLKRRLSKAISLTNRQQVMTYEPPKTSDEQL